MPATSASLYEQLFALTTVMKQRVVDNFSGDALNERWGTGYQDGNASTYSIAMDDAVDGGLKITCDDTAANRGAFIGFITNGTIPGDHNVRQYAHDGSVAIFSAKFDSKTNINHSYVGLTQQARGDAGYLNESDILAKSVNSNWVLRTADGSTNSDTAGSVTLDTSYHSFKMQLGSSNVISTIDGVTDVTKTTNRPTVRLAPCVAAQTNTTAAVSINVNYCEAYNT